MKKSKMSKKLIFINLTTLEINYYNIQVNSVGYNDFQVVFHWGIGKNKGSKQMIETKSYEEAMSTAYKKFYELKVKKYQELEDMEKVIESMGMSGQSEKKEEVKPSNGRPKRTKTVAEDDPDEPVFHCDECSEPIKKSIYDEINKWGRGGGGWDKNPEFVGYKKVLCIKCQWKHDIFKKRM